MINNFLTVSGIKGREQEEMVQGESITRQCKAAVQAIKGGVAMGDTSA